MRLIEESDEPAGYTTQSDHLLAVPVQRNLPRMSPTIPLATFPPQKLREKIGQEDWQACVQAWTLFIEKLLSLGDEEFTSSAGGSNISSFLTSYAHETALASSRLQSGAAQLHNLVYRLTIRMLKQPIPAPPLLTFGFLSECSSIFGPSPTLKYVLSDVWNGSRLDTSPEFSRHKKTFIALGSEKAVHVDLHETLLRISAFMRSCAEYARFLLAGSELIDVLASLWFQATQGLRRKIVEVSFLALRSLTLEPDPNPTALLDQLYDLKSAAENDKLSQQAQFLRHLVSTTALLRVLRQRLRDPIRTRAQPLITYLSTLDDGTLANRRAVRKGKRAQRSSFGHGAIDNIHMHKMASVSQIQELFPDMGAGFVVKLLDHYNENVEQVTAGLLEDSLPAFLASADRSEPLSLAPTQGQPHHDFAPRNTPPLEIQRRNVYDNDDFDNLAISTKKLHIGKKKIEIPEHSVSDKARTLSALAAFDSDDDERDDTYDVEDVGGTVDVQGYDKEHEDVAVEQHTESLYRAWKLDPGSFQRDATARKSPARQALRSETNMTDEAIEGFAVMLQRDPRRQRALQAKYPDFVGEQNQIQSTRWRQNEEGAESTEEESSIERGRGRGERRGRGNGVGRQGRGRGRGNVAGPADDKDTQIARQRKDENKAQRANHNRRAQRAKKVARAGFPG